MANQHAARLTLMDALLPQVSIWRDALLILGFSLLTGICAQMAIRLPFSPVPITGQTFAVLLSGALLGARKGALSQLLYLAEGFAGLPVFAPTGPMGFARLLGPTGGYLLSFPLAAFVVGRLAERGWTRRFARTALALVAGEAAIYLIGIPWLAFVLRRSLAEALPLGLYPFLIGDAVKALLVSASLPLAWRLLKPAN